MIVRPATTSDYAALHKLVEEFFKNNDTAHFGFDVDIESIAKLITKLTLEHFGLLLETPNKRIVGGIGGMIVPFQFDTKLKLFQEILFYVKRGFRQHSQKLLTELKKSCREMKVDIIIIAHINDGTLDKMERFYNARGFKKLETHFVTRVNI